MTATRAQLLSARAAVLLWLQRRREAQSAARAKANAMIRDFGPDDAYRAARQWKRNARSRRAAAHWRRVARAVGRMARKIPHGDMASMVD